MKIAEIFHSKDEIRDSRDGMGHQGDKTLRKLKDTILSGEVPEIANASYSKGDWAWGDLKKLGWAHRGQRSVDAGAGIMEVWWQYTGPGEIIVVTRGNPGSKRRMSKGDKTPPVEVDYS